MSSCKLVTTKIINSPETCVDDNLRGVVALFPTLQLHPKHRVVTLRRENDSGRVAILGGGGSGHEPFAAGLIGQGMLDGAVAGGVFASPPTGHVLYAITQLYKYNTGGVLVLLGNYTGDRLNFGKAFEKAKIAGIKVEGFIVGEDVASSHNKTGGRSMCGEVFLYKMCGAMSANGCDIQTIRNMAQNVNKNMATLGICLTACSLPGQPPLFEINPGEMEVGAGVHGEAGVEKREMSSAKSTVGLIMDQIIAFSPNMTDLTLSDRVGNPTLHVSTFFSTLLEPAAIVQHLKLTAGNTVAAMINNMGGTSLLEMNIVAAEIQNYLQLKQMKMVRLYSGHFKTSLEMHGFQICLLNLSHEDGENWLRLLDSPTTAGGWTGGEMSQGEHGVHLDDDTLVTTDDNEMVSGPILNTLEQKKLREYLQAACEKLMENEELLNRLDSGCGDGDCGITLKKFALAVVGEAPSAGPQRAARVLWRLADLAETDMGGTSGGLYSLGLSAASVAMAGATANDRHAWLSALESAIAAISKYGGAEPGDRTMLDPLHRMSQAFKQNINAELKTLLQVIEDAAEQGAKDTASMTAKAGRASYVCAGRTRGEDAGARAVALWTHALVTCIRAHTD